MLPPRVVTTCPGVKVCTTEIPPPASLPVPEPVMRLLVIVLKLMAICPLFEMPPPLVTAVLPVIVLLATMAVPSLRMPPPLVSLALFSSVLPVMTKVLLGPSFWMRHLPLNCYHAPCCSAG